MPEAHAEPLLPLSPDAVPQTADPDFKEKEKGLKRLWAPGPLGESFQVPFLIPFSTSPKDPAFRQSEEEGKVEPQQNIEQKAGGRPAVDMPHSFPEEQACLAAILGLGAMTSLEATEFSF